MSQPKKPTIKQRLVALEQDNVLLKMRVYTLEQLVQELIQADLVTRPEVEAAFNEFGRRLEHHPELGLSRTIDVGTGAHLERP